MKRLKIYSLAWITLLTLTAAMQACLGSTYYGQIPKTPHIPDTYANITLAEFQNNETQNKLPNKQQWWLAYQDQDLNNAINTTLDNSLTLKTAYLRILQAQTQITQAKSSYYPTLSMSAGAGYGGQASQNSTQDPSYNLGLNLAYEIDIWGAVTAEAHVNELAYYSAKDAAETAILSLTSQFVQNWLNVRYYKARKKLVLKLLELTEQYTELVRKYYATGQATAMDVLQQEEQARSLKSSLNTLDINQNLAVAQLNLLSGTIDTIVVPENLDFLPEPLTINALDAPEKLLTTRPDIRTALRSAQQMDARIIIAIADRLPTLRLSSALSLSANSITELFSKLIWNIAANFAASLFDGFRGSAAITRAKLSFLEAETTYGNTVLNAVLEVENALLKYKQAQIELQNAQLDLEQNEKLLEAARIYYIGGSIDYNRVLSLLQAHINASIALLDAQKTILVSQINLIIATGGTWMTDIVAKGEQNTQQIFENTEKNSRNQTNNPE